MNKASINCV